MLKSVFTFGFLPCSMIMLAAIPLFNQNNFSNVKAQEYDGSSIMLMRYIANILLK